MGWITNIRFKFCTSTICTKKMAIKKIIQDLHTLIQAILYGLASVIDENTEIETDKERRKVFTS